jgi:hypothetical protein
MRNSAAESPGSQTVAANLRWNTQHIPDLLSLGFYTPEEISGARIVDWGADRVLLSLADGRNAVVSPKDVKVCS